MSMTKPKKGNPPCSKDTAACNLPVSDAHTDADPDQLQFQNDDWPKFLVIKSLSDKPILKHGLFIIGKAIQGIVGEPKNVTSLKKAGLLLVEVDKRHQAIALLKTKLLHDIQVEITPHRTLNSVKGVIFCDYLEGMSNEEILKNLKETNQRVKEVYRITSMKSGVKTDTNMFILTFNGDVLPEKMYVGPIRVNVRQYIPNPRRCFQCQKLGHTKGFCNGVERCDNCGQPGHQRGDCGVSPFCVNCEGDHPLSSRECPVWKKVFWNSNLLKTSHSKRLEIELKPVMLKNL